MTTWGMVSLLDSIAGAMWNVYLNSRANRVLCGGDMAADIGAKMGDKQRCMATVKVSKPTDATATGTTRAVRTIGRELQ